MKQPRQYGSGSVVFARGRWMARLPQAYGRALVGRFDTEAEAKRVLAAALHQLAHEPAPIPKGETLATYGAKWLDSRKHMRSFSTQANLWNRHIAKSDLAQIPIADLSRIRIKQWISSLDTIKTHRSEKSLSHQTKVHLINLVRRCLHEACDDGIIKSNPALRLEVRSPVSMVDTWHYLEPEQQSKLLEHCRGPERWIVETALYTGCRKGELWTLHLEDVHLDEPEPWIFIQYGGRKNGKLQPPKNGRARRVPLLPAAVHALKKWMTVLSSYTTSTNKEWGNPHGLVFPGKFGLWRDKSKQPVCWNKAIKATGLAVRWHDLRHTCASSLVAGWWGRRWSLQEVKELLGHSSVKVTERYAHLSAGALASAAAATLVPDNLVHPPKRVSRSSAISLSGRLDSNQRLLAPKAVDFQVPTETYDALYQIATSLAASCLEIISDGGAAHYEGRALVHVLRLGVELKVFDKALDRSSSQILGNDKHKRRLITDLADEVLEVCDEATLLIDGCEVAS